MAFAMKMNYTEAIVPGSLENWYAAGKRMGYRFDIRLNYYRGHYLSDIDEFCITVDGVRVADEKVQLCLNGKKFQPCQLQSCFTEFWKVWDAATVEVLLPGGLESGEHIIDLQLMLRVPYLPIGPDHMYMPLDCCGSGTLNLA